METKNDFAFNVRWNFKTTVLFAVLLLLPNALGMVNITTPYGFKLHFFQAAIFIAAMLFGPMGGMLSGLTGSFYSAVAMSNPYLIVGNALLGFFAGLFFRKKMHFIAAAMLAFLIQLPWLVATDYLLVGLPFAFIWKLVIALAASNLLWSAVAIPIASRLSRSI